MKKFISIMLVFAALVAFSGCLSDDNGSKTVSESAETVAKKYLECLYNAKFSDAEKYVAFSSDEVLKESAKQYPDDLGYDNGRIEIDGEVFESVGKMIEAAEEIAKGTVLNSLVKKEEKTLSKEDFEKRFEGNPLSEALIGTLEDEVLNEVVSVDFEIDAKIVNNTVQGTVSVLMIKQKGEWKVLSPTWISWILLGHNAVK